MSDVTVEKGMTLLESFDHILAELDAISESIEQNSKETQRLIAE